MKLLVFFAALSVALMSCAHAPSKEREATTSTSVARTSANVSSNGLSAGEILYDYRCKGCHEPATPGAPPRIELRGREPKEILKALKSGKMKMMSTGLSEEEMRQIAVFLTGKPLPKKGELAAIQP